MRKSRYVVAISVETGITRGPTEKPTGLVPTRKSMFWRSGRTSTFCLWEEKLMRQLPGREDACRSYQHRVLANDEGTGPPWSDHHLHPAGDCAMNDLVRRPKTTDDEPAISLYLISIA